MRPGAESFHLLACIRLPPTDWPEEPGRLPPILPERIPSNTPFTEPVTGLTAPIRATSVKRAYGSGPVTARAAGLG